MRVPVVLFGLWAMSWGVGHEAEASTPRAVTFLYGYAQGKKKAPKARLLKLLSQHQLKPAVVRRFSGSVARILRNTIFALKGARFKSTALQRFFAKQTWYRGTRPAAQVKLSGTEAHNVGQLRAAAVVNSAMSSFAAPWPRDARFLGKKKDPRVQAICLRFATYDVIRTPKKLYVQKTAKACKLAPKLRVLGVPTPNSQEFAGLAQGHLMVRRFGSSDYIDLWIYEIASKKLVFHKKSMSPQADPSFVGGSFTYWASLKAPKLCPAPRGIQGSSKKYNRWVKKCWPAFQRRHPGLKKSSPPVCKCGPLGPYLLFHRGYSLKAWNQGSRLTGRVKCGCAS